MERAADYPRPPRLEWAARTFEIVLGGVVIARSIGAWRVLETFHPPTYYLPPESFILGALAPGSPRSSWCEWKGRARYWTIVAPGTDRREADAGWSYPDPAPAYADLAGCLAVYPGRMDACHVDGEAVRPQPGGFYGGWITPDIMGPFKGAPGTEWW